MTDETTAGYADAIVRARGNPRRARGGPARRRRARRTGAASERARQAVPRADRRARRPTWTRSSPTSTRSRGSPSMTRRPRTTRSEACRTPRFVCGPPLDAPGVLALGPGRDPSGRAGALGGVEERRCRWCSASTRRRRRRGSSYAMRRTATSTRPEARPTRSPPGPGVTLIPRNGGTRSSRRGTRPEAPSV